MVKAKAVNRGKLGWAVEYNNSAYLSAMPDKETALKAAAADDLLESLKEMVADLTSHATLGLNEREVAMLNKAEAAIAKATGNGQ